MVLRDSEMLTLFFRPFPPIFPSSDRPPRSSSEGKHSKEGKINRNVVEYNGKRGIPRIGDLFFSKRHLSVPRMRINGLRFRMLYTERLFWQFAG